MTGRELVRKAYSDQYKYAYGQSAVFSAIYGHSGKSIITLNGVPLTLPMIVCRIHYNYQSSETVLDLLLSGF